MEPMSYVDSVGRGCPSQRAAARHAEPLGACLLSLVWAFFFILLRNVFGFGFLLFSFDIWTYLFSVLVPVVLSCANAKASQNGLM